MDGGSEGSDDYVVAPEPLRSSSLDTIQDFEPQKSKELLIDKLLNSLTEKETTIQQKIYALERLDVSVQIVDFKLTEANHTFLSKIAEVKEERAKLLTSVENRSELSLILHDLDKRISSLEKEQEEKIMNLNLEKIELQQQSEALIFQLDEDTSFMQDELKCLTEELNLKMGAMYQAQKMLLNQKYDPVLKQLQTALNRYEQLQINGWKIDQPDVKLAEILDQHGLKVTSSGILLTSGGSLMTFQDAHDKGYFKDIRISLDNFFKDRDQQKLIAEQIGVRDSSAYSEASTVGSKFASDDVKYLKQYVGKPLTLALAEVIAKQPKDPIHYLGHYLFKYRYNQEIEEIQKREVEELTEERKRLSEERWKKFVEDEARNAVVNMILRAEKIAFENELKRIEEEQLLAADEEEGDQENINELLEEAKDKFE